MPSIREAVRKAVPFSDDAYVTIMTRARMLRSRKQVKMLLQQATPIRLDLGGGYEPGRPGWVNVDITNEADLFWDLRSGIPFPEGSIDALYTSHLLEHLSYDDMQQLLTECLRVLRPGGQLSVVVPNARMYVEAYLGIHDIPDEYLAWEPANNHTTAIDALNYIAYMGGEHRYMFDQDNLEHILRSAGFQDVSQRDFNPLIDRIERDYESIYAVGVKSA